jgi:phosphoserine phosphatase RsbU/P
MPIVLGSLKETTLIFSIKTKIVLAIGIPLLAAYCVMTWIEYRLGRAEALAVMESQLKELAFRQAAELNNNLTEAQQVAHTLAVVAATTPDLSPDRIKTWLEDNVRGNPKVYGMAMAFEPYAYSPQNEWFSPYCCRDQSTGLRYIDVANVYNYAQWDWYKLAKSTQQPLWTEPFFDTGAGERIICTYSVPFFQDGKLRGVMTTDVLALDILDDLAQVNIGSGYCILISRKGAFISHPDSFLIMHESIFSLAKQHNDEELADAGLQMVAGKTGVCRVRDYRGGGPAWMVFAPVENSQWSLAAIIPENEVLAPIYARLSRSLGILAAGCVVILGIVLFVSHRVTRPINRLTAAAELLAQGNLDVQVAGVRGADEIARLSRTFNNMVVDLKTNVEGRIREETARKRVEGELRAAREIQSALLPAMLPPELNREFSLHAINAPARLVAGDFYDFFFVDRHKLALVMADVSGKGVPAAMFMAVARTRLRDFAAPDKTPGDIITALNRGLAEENENCMFVTLFFGFYNVSSGELNYVNAGHNPPYLVRNTGRFDTLEPTGPLVAPFPDAEFLNAECRLAPGELLLLYTDGITEAHPADGPLFGEDRLKQLLQSVATKPAAEACQSIIQAATDYSRGELCDDATVLALRRMFV